ncbi:hypothetical protein GCM10007096_14980 [Pullulanibacillus pueri]|uniref:Competence protein ComGG n=1 Tax=Pullulanibacillus pueri TaxID=1437324 RepID=A0A8J2ZUN4_9BACL|nr:hypothetical protein GCM10007096_14980 [Pullulanibacillus pueri]
MPVTLIMVFFFSAFILYDISQLTLDRKIVEERTLFVKEEELKKMAARDIVKRLRKDPMLITTDDLNYTVGTIHYQVVDGDEDEKKIEVTLLVPPEHQATFQFSYNIDKDKIIKWVD